MAEFRGDERRNHGLGHLLCRLSVRRNSDRPGRHGLAALRRAQAARAIGQVGRVRSSRSPSQRRSMASSIHASMLSEILLYTSLLVVPDGV